MNQRLALTALLCAPLALACFQELDPNAAAGNMPKPSTGLTTATMTPPIEIDLEGRVTNNSCEVTIGQAVKVLEANCAGCHSGRDLGARQGQPPFDFLFDFERMKTQLSSVADVRDATKKMRFLAAGDPDNSRVYSRVARGEMPPPDVVGLPARPRPTVSDISVLRQWISACTGGSPPPSVGLPPPAPVAPPAAGCAARAPPAAPPPGIDPPPVAPPAPPSAPPPAPPGGVERQARPRAAPPSWRAGSSRSRAAPRATSRPRSAGAAGPPAPRATRWR